MRWWNGKEVAKADANVNINIHVICECELFLIVYIQCSCKTVSTYGTNLGTIADIQRNESEANIPQVVTDLVKFLGIDYFI
jgi:hypothetical protein